MNWVAPIKDDETLEKFKAKLREMDDKYYIMFEIGVGTGLQLQEIPDVHSGCGTDFRPDGGTFRVVYAHGEKTGGFCRLQGIQRVFRHGNLAFSQMQLLRPQTEDIRLGFRCAGILFREEKLHTFPQSQTL